MSATKWILKISIMIVCVSVALVSIPLVFGETLPDSGQLIYDAMVNRNFDIFTLDIGLRIRHNLTRNASLDTQAVWSPNGRYIAFQSRRDGRQWLYIMEADGRNVYPLTNDPKVSQYNPTWSPDSAYVYFRSHPGVNAPIFRVRTDGSEMESFDQLAFEQLFARRFNPDQFMVMSYKNGNWGIFIHGLNWRDRRQLTNNNILFREMPRWSSDARLPLSPWN